MGLIEEEVVTDGETVPDPDIDLEEVVEGLSVGEGVFEGVEVSVSVVERVGEWVGVKVTEALVVTVVEGKAVELEVGGGGPKKKN